MKLWVILTLITPLSNYSDGELWFRTRINLNFLTQLCSTCCVCTILLFLTIVPCENKCCWNSVDSNAHLFGSKSQQHWQEIEHLSHHSGPAEDSNCISENCMWLFHEAYLEQTNKQTNLFIQPVLLFIMLIFLSEIPLQETSLFQSACQFLGQPYINSLKTRHSKAEETSSTCLSL